MRHNLAYFEDTDHFSVMRSIVFTVKEKVCLKLSCPIL